CSIKLLPVFVVHLIMAELSVADSSAGPLMICMRADFLPAGRCSEAVWTEKITMLTETAITNRRSLLMCRPHGCFTLQKTHRRRGATAKCHLSLRLFPLACKVDEPEEKNSHQLRTTPRKRVGVRVGCGKAVGERLHEGDDLVFFRGRQTEFTNRHVLRLWDLGCRPAVHLLLGSRGAVSRFHIERVHIPRVIEVDDLLQALQVSVVHICFRKALAVGTLRPHVRVTRGGHLHEAVESRCQRCPVRVRISPGEVS